MAHLRLIASVLALPVALLGCPPDRAVDPPQPRPTPPLPAPPAPPPSPFPAAPGEKAVGRVLLKRLQLGVSLPGRSGWKLQPRGGSQFTTLDHAGTASRLLLRVWSEPENMNAARCEERVREERQLPVRAGAIEQRDVEIPRGFATRLDVGLVEEPSRDVLRGYLMAFGASRRRCFAFIYTTEANAGADGERVMGERLAYIERISFGELELKRDLPY